ncbi:MAG: hypothetical protein AAF497_25035 [Planctomycetota bacterium]
MIRDTLLIVFALISLSFSIPASGQLSKSKRIDDLFAQWDSVNSPGYFVAVIEKGQFVLQRGYGMADLEQAAPLIATHAVEKLLESDITQNTESAVNGAACSRSAIP